MEEHPDARKFVADWLKAREEGDTKWGAKAVVHHLRENHGFPFVAASAFMNWLSTNG